MESNVKKQFCYLLQRTLRNCGARNILRPIKKYGRDFQNISLPPMTVTRMGWQFRETIPSSSENCHCLHNTSDTRVFMTWQSYGAIVSSTNLWGAYSEFSKKEISPISSQFLFSCRSGRACFFVTRSAQY